TRSPPEFARVGSLACEAGGSIKPGAQAPGSIKRIGTEPVKRVTVLMSMGCRPLRGFGAVFIIDPGACAPGFMLSACFAGSQSASQALSLLRRLSVCLGSTSIDRISIQVKRFYS